MAQVVPKISVIVPIYKAEKYLHKCVDSILAQTFKNFELILVDDGSPDRSGQICDEYAIKDPRIKVIHKPNGGVSSARQCGVDHASGVYTIHADPDDWVESTMLEELYAKAVSENADMVICDFYRDTGTKSVYVRQRPSALDHKTVRKELFQQLHGSCWNKLLKRACYSRLGIRFQEDLSFCEDLYFNVSLLANDIRIAYLPKAFYHYVCGINETSITKNVQLDYLKHLYDKFNRLTKSDEILNELCKRHIAYMYVVRVFLNGTLSSAMFIAECKNYERYALKYRRASWPEKISLWLSFNGYYRFAFNIYNLTGNIWKGRIKWTESSKSTY